MQRAFAQWPIDDTRIQEIKELLPPGHVLLFFLGTQIAQRIPDRGEWWIALAAAPLVAVFAWNGRDTLGPLLYALFAGSTGAPVGVSTVGPKEVGIALFGPYLLLVELASMLLLAALVAAYHLGRHEAKE